MSKRKIEMIIRTNIHLLRDQNTLQQVRYLLETTDAINLVTRMYNSGSTPLRPGKDNINKFS